MSSASAVQHFQCPTHWLFVMHANAFCNILTFVTDAILIAFYCNIYVQTTVTAGCHSPLLFCQ